MRLSQPTKKVFWACMVIAIVAIVAFILSFVFVTTWLGPVAWAVLFVAFGLLTASVALKGV